MFNPLRTGDTNPLLTFEGFGTVRSNIPLRDIENPSEQKLCFMCAITYFCIKTLKEKNQYIRGKNGSTEHSKGNKTVPEKVAKTRTEDGHKWNTKTSTTI